MTPDQEQQFEEECRAAGLELRPEERELIFDLWAENLPRRTALRGVAFDYFEPPFEPPTPPSTFPKGMFWPAPSSSDALHWKTASELAGMLARREISSQEITENALARIEAHDPVLRAFDVVTAEIALEAASAADGRFAKGEVLSPLQGIPVAFKCFAGIKGYPHRVGSEKREHVIATETADVVTRSMESGAITLGLTRTHQWAAGMAVKEGKWATGRNPWNIERIPGGSSSGTAVAVAAGMVPGGMGNDSAGSIRMPAANCNLVGLKTTLGLVSNGGLPPYAWSLDTCGPLARSAQDAGLYLEGMIGRDAFGRYSAGLEQPLKGRIIGVPRAYFWDRDDIRDDVRARCEDALTVLERAGATLKTVEIPSVHWNDAIYTTLISETYQVHREGLRADPDYASAWFSGHVRAAALFSAEDLIRAHRMRARLAAELNELFKEVEALVLPGQAVPATPFSNSFIRSITQPRSQFMRPFNVTGLPALTTPCGFSDDHMPLGISFAGPAFSEATLLSIAHQFEADTQWLSHHPDEGGWVS